jgi:hypothetical protein
MAIRIDKAVSDSGKAQEGTIELRDRVLREFQGARSGGIYNYRNVRGGASLSLHAEGRAVDIFPQDKSQGDAIAAWAVKNASCYQIQRVIWYRKIWDGYTQKWREYTGEHPHTDHVHIEQNRCGANDQDCPPLRLCPNNVRLAAFGANTLGWIVLSSALVGMSITLYREHGKGKRNNYR